MRGPWRGGARPEVGRRAPGGRATHDLRQREEAATATNGRADEQHHHQSRRPGDGGQRSNPERPGRGSRWPDAKEETAQPRANRGSTKRLHNEATGMQVRRAEDELGERKETLTINFGFVYHVMNSTCIH